MTAVRTRITRGSVDRRPQVEICIGGEVALLDLADIGESHLDACEPIRQFGWHSKQRHHPGWYWSVTEHDHVAYESRLELARLRLADFDADVLAIRAQPFRLVYADDEGRSHRHVPDFALSLTSHRRRIVNVKPRRRLEDTVVRTALVNAHRAFESCGWETEIWSGDDPVLITNIQFLAGYRNPALFDPALVGRAKALVSPSQTMCQLESLLSEHGVPEPRPIVLHLLWTGDLRTDLRRTLEPDSMLEGR